MASRTLFNRFGAPFAVLAAFLLPFKLTLGYVGLIPLVCLWIDQVFRHRKKLPEVFSEPGVKAFIFFSITATMTSLFGINIGRSVAHLGTLFFFPLAVLAFYEIAKTEYRSLMTALLSGEALICAVAILRRAYPEFSPSFIGAVSQSGQIALILFIAISFFTFPDPQRKSNPQFRLIDTGMALLFFVLLMALGFPKSLNIPRALALAAIGLVLLFNLVTSRGAGAEIDRHYLMRVILPLLFAGLLVNLKRGPWAGVFIALSIYCYLHKPRLLLALVLSALVAVLAIHPIQSRLLHIHEHFFLSGGRSAIWQIGYELSMKYPLGIGFDNSGFLRLFSNEIPANLKHFHNNFLNVLTETGWAGLLLYCVCMYQFIAIGFRRRLTPLYRSITALSCGLIAWQIAGLVEYNFGDSAVVSIAYLAMGLLLFENELVKSPETSWI